MSLQQTVNYDIAANLSYNAALVETVSPVTKLKLTNISWPQITTTYTTSAGCTFDPSFIEFAAGVMRQKDLAPNRLFYNDFASLNAAYSGGVATGTPFNGAAVSGGKLDLRAASGVDRYVTYQAFNNCSSVKGAVRLKYTPAYSGSPGTTQQIFTAVDASGGLNNSIVIEHQSSGDLRYQIRDSAGAGVVVLAAAWVPVSGTEYEIEMNYDSTGGSEAYRIFVDGVQLGATLTTAVARTAYPNPGFIVIGASYNLAKAANFEIDDLQLFDEPQHTANYTPVAAIPFKYGASVVDVPDAVYGVLPTDFQLVQWGSNANAQPQFILGGYWWDGAAWSISNGTYAESTSAGTIVSNIATFPLLVGTNALSIKIPFPASNTQGIVTSTTPRAESNGYSQTDETVTTNSYVQMDCLMAFSAVDTAAGSDEVRYLLARYNVVGGSPTYMWWDGAAWSVSNGTYAESNTPADINTNAMALDLTTGYYVRFFVFLHSDDGLTTPSVESITYDYCFFVFPGTLSKCFVYGWLTEVDCAFFADATVTIQNKKPFYHSGYLIPVSEQTFTVDASGYWEAEIIETESVQVPGADPAEPGYTFKINYTDPIAKTVTYNNIVVPNQGSAALEDLIP